MKRKTIFKMGESTDLPEYLAKMERREESIQSTLADYGRRLNVVLEKSKLYPNFPSLMEQQHSLGQRINEIKAMLEECQQIRQKIQTFM